jgi:outer membrane protein assembly factor BamB
MMTFGQYARKMKSGTTNNIGLYYYSLVDQKKLRMIDGLDRKLKRPYSDSAAGAFDTSALIDRSTKTLVAIGTNGLLYTETLDMRIYKENMKLEFKDPSETVTMMSHTKGQKESLVAVESSLAMYGSYAYYADMEGILRCVDTTTMTTAWAVDTGDTVRAAIALDLVEGENANTLWLYTANLVNNGRSKGNVTIRRYNAMTGEEDWAFAIHCADGKKKDVTFNSTVIPGAMASPVIGQQGLGDLVYFTLSSVSATGAKMLNDDAAMAGVIIALDKETGDVVWHRSMDTYCYSSPVAVYDQGGKGWIIQACANGTIYLLDGLSGETVNTLAVNGVIEGSPAVYGDMMVIGTTGKNTSYIYGIKIK